jgi:sulfite reductase subunit B
VKNQYQSDIATVKNVINESSNIKTFVLETKNQFNFHTGQFVELFLQDFGESPFTPSSSPFKTEKIDITIMKAGFVTEEIHKLKTGDTIGIRGPFGNGYPIEDFKGKEILVVGGGVGLAPLRSLLYTLFNDLSDYSKIVIKFGAKSPSDIIYKDEINEWGKKKNVTLELTVDNGDKNWKGNVGLVTSIVRKNDVSIDKSIAIVCGPPVMMKFATFKLIELGFKPDQIYLSMEKNMSCGVGKCGHCRLGNYYVCKSGPVFTYESIENLEGIWD